MPKLGGQAVVIGGSIAGLAAAQALSKHFDRVVVLERDKLADGAEIHQSIPQGNHYHTLLAGGYRVMKSLYEGFEDHLLTRGAVAYRAPRDVTFFRNGTKTYNPTGDVLERRDFDIESLTLTRGLLETSVRELTQQTANVEFMNPARATGMRLADGRVVGLEFDLDGDGRFMETDLVIEATGRSSRLPRWLRDEGFGAVHEQQIGVDFAYSSAKFEAPDGLDLTEAIHIMFGLPGERTRGAIVGAVESDLWHVSLAGRFGDYPPGDADGFLAFARAMDEPFLQEFLDSGARMVSAVTSYRYPRSLWRRYDLMDAFPGGLIPVGDALASFNPVYGQGMSSAANQIAALDGALETTERGELDDLRRRVLPEMARAAAVPWGMAANQDYVWEQTVGDRPDDLAQTLAFIAAMGKASAAHPDVHRAATEVAHLARPQSDLMDEPYLNRIAAYL